MPDSGSSRSFSNGWRAFVNAGLRGHQFVEEGAEEVLEGGVFRSRRSNLAVDALAGIDDVLLLFL